MSGVMLTNELCSLGADVIALTRTERNLQPAHVQRRMSNLSQQVTVIEGVSHGSQYMPDVLKELKAKTLVIHGHPMENYKSRDYQIGNVAGQMISNLRKELNSFQDAGGIRVVYSGSVFEPNSQYPVYPNIAGSIYGISKAMVWEALRLDCGQLGLFLDRVTIPNPFGPGEHGRFGNYLMSQWLEEKEPIVQTPDYIRDNIPVKELAKRYARFLIEPSIGGQNLRPSGYIESQFEFAQRMGREFGVRLGKSLQVHSLFQMDFLEPKVLINDGSRTEEFLIHEETYWDEYFKYLFESIKPN